MLYGMNNPHGGDVYGAEVALDFSSNVNPLGTPPSVVKAIQNAVCLVRQYPDPYCRSLTAAISAYEGLPESYILCGNGAAELIYCYCQALQAKHASELAPTFSEYSAASAHFGAAVSRYALQEEDHFSVDDGLLPFLQTQKPDVLFLCTPNNPTGQTISRTLLERVLALCAGQGTHMLLDECFLDFTDAKSAKDLLAQYPNLLILKAFTKNYALAGVRVGYCLTSDAELLTKMAACAQPWNVSILAQAAGTASLLETNWVQNAKALVSIERAFLAENLSSLGFSVCPSEANYLLFRAPVGLDQRLLREKIAIRNCGNYAGLCPGWFRIAVKQHDENEMLLAAMRRAMEDSTWH